MGDQGVADQGASPGLMGSRSRDHPVEGQFLQSDRQLRRHAVEPQRGATGHPLTLHLLEHLPVVAACGKVCLPGKEKRECLLHRDFIWSNHTRAAARC